MAYRQTARSEKIRQASRTRILEAARTLFAQQGFEATTMQHIVREARTSIGNAYFYFENKEGLVKALVEDGLRATWAWIDPIIASVEPGPPRIAVHVYANTLTLLGTEKDLAAIAMASMPGVVRHITEIMWERMSALLKANFPERDEQDVVMMAAMVFGANRTVAELSLAGILKVPTKAVADFIVAWHLRALGLPEREIKRIVRLVTRACAGRRGNARARQHQ